EEDMDATGSSQPKQRRGLACKAGPVEPATCSDPASSYPIIDDKQKDCGIDYKASDPVTCPSQPPGAMYIYSNVGFSALGYSIAEAYGTCKGAKKGDDWASVIDSQILTPLQMNHT